MLKLMTTTSQTKFWQWAKSLYCCLMILLLGLPLQASADTVPDTIDINIHTLAEWKKYAEEYGNDKKVLEKYYIRLKL